MITFERFTLPNGLRVLIHEDHSTPMVAVNVLYDVGSKDEQPEKTGFAHLFEHLMFSGSLNVKNFDDYIQNASGESNAFTNSDMTNFYDVVPAENLEMVLWLESDRMMSLKFNKKSLAVQRKVVVEEFYETCLNEPYGDAMHHLLDLAYQTHPYRWPTIGKIPQHVENATLDEVKEFFQTYYRPNNAVLAIAGNCTIATTRNLVEKWFGDIPMGDVPLRHLPQEPPQQVFQQKTTTAEVPVEALFLAFHTPHRLHPDYYVVDLLSDVLANGQSSRLYRRLVKEQEIFSEIDAYITGSIDPGLFLIEGKPADGISLDIAQDAIWQELEALKNQPMENSELQKLKNKAESTLIFSETGSLAKAMNLAFFELIGHPDLINQEKERYQEVTVVDMQRVAQAVFDKNNCSLLIYKPAQVAP